MRETGSGILPAECLVEHIVQRQRREPLLAPDDLGDFHQVVVHDIGQVVCGQLVRSLPQNLVVQGVGVDLDMAADHVVHCHDGILRHLETDGPVGGLLKQPGSFFLAQCQGIAQGETGFLIVGEGLSAGLSCAAHRIQLLGGVESVVSVSVRDELLCKSAVDAASLALPVGGVRVLRGSSLDDLPVFVYSLVRYNTAPV